MNERYDECYCAAVIPLTCRVCKAQGKVSPADRPPPPPVGYDPRVHDLKVLLLAAERHGLLLAEVSEDGGVVLSGDNERLEEANRRIQAKMSTRVRARMRCGEEDE